MVSIGKPVIVDDDGLQHGTRATARIIDVCEQTVRNYCEKGRLHATRTSTGRWLITQREIERFLEVSR